MTMTHTYTACPDLTPIVDAVRNARIVITASEPGWAERILAGDPLALEAGVLLRESVNALQSELEAFALDTVLPSGVMRHSIDLGSIECALGAYDIIGATLVAEGELPHDDPEIHARFKPVRLAHQRRQYEHFMAMVESQGGDTSEYRNALALMDQGIEPE